MMTVIKYIILLSQGNWSSKLSSKKRVNLVINVKCILCLGDLTTKLIHIKLKEICYKLICWMICKIFSLLIIEYNTHDNQCFTVKACTFLNALTITFPAQQERDRETLCGKPQLSPTPVLTIKSQLTNQT